MTVLADIEHLIGNWAQPHEVYRGACYCGWMDLHKDEPYEDFNKGIWSLSVIEIDPDAVLVHRVEGVFVIEELRPNQVVHFRYDRWHGLLPRNVAQQLEGGRYWKKCKAYTEWLKEILPNVYTHNGTDEQDKARFLWEFLE